MASNYHSTYLARISSQFPWGVGGPVYLEGRPTLSCVDMNGILLRLSALAASSFVRSSTKANFPESRQLAMGFPGAVVSPTCSIAFPKNSVNACSVISGVVFPTNNSLLIFSSALPASGVTLGGRDVPVNSCQVWAGTCGPEYLLGLDTFRHDPRNGIPLRLSALLASSADAHSMKANFSSTRATRTLYG